MKSAKPLLTSAKRLSELHDELMGQIGQLQRLILPHLDFGEGISDGISIFYQMSDGVVLEFDSYNAPLGKCLKIIDEKGKLTLEDYMGLAI